MASTAKKSCVPVLPCTIWPQRIVIEGYEIQTQHVPASYALSAEEALSRFPALDRNGLTGAVVIHDGHMHSPQRLALAFLHAAEDAGADVAKLFGGKIVSTQT